jgi:hypothetical protein
MKKLLTTLIIGAFAFVGTAPEADARSGRGYDRGYERGHHGGHHPHGYRSHKRAPSNHIYISSYRHGRPIFTERHFVGWDRFGRPLFAYRTVAMPRHYTHARRAYYAPPRGTSVSFNFGF